jgi:hypothetical protein
MGEGVKTTENKIGYIGPVAKGYGSFGNDVFVLHTKIKIIKRKEQRSFD